jgi:hypothetical protein
MPTEKAMLFGIDVVPKGDSMDEKSLFETEMDELRGAVRAAEKAVANALKRAPRPFGKGDAGCAHLENALAELRRARVYADAYVDVARQDAGLPR